MIELVAAPRITTPQLPLCPLYLGQEQCEPMHRYGRVRDDYLIHYVVSGSGRFRTNRTNRILHCGQAFVIRPGEEHWYQADRLDPWSYWWIGFSGPPGDILGSWFGYSDLPVVIHVLPTVRDRLQDAYMSLWAMFEASTALQTPIVYTEGLIRVLGVLFGRTNGLLFPTHRDQRRNSGLSPQFEQGMTDQWARIASFLDAHYTEPMTVEALCRSVGVSRAQMHRLFVDHTGHSAKAELTLRRMHRASFLLEDPGRPIGRVAALCGYTEYQTFERQFRAHFGMAPRDFRRVSDRQKK